MNRVPCGVHRTCLSGTVPPHRPWRCLGVRIRQTKLSCCCGGARYSVAITTSIRVIATLLLVGLFQVDDVFGVAVVDGVVRLGDGFVVDETTRGGVHDHVAGGL